MTDTGTSRRTFKYPYWEVGDLIEVIVGMPGPDRDLAIVTDVRDNTYYYKLKVWGEGDWFSGSWVHEDDALYTPINASPKGFPYWDKYALEAGKMKDKAAADQARPTWEDRDDDLTPAVKADFNTEGFYKRYARAQELVSNRHSKGGLVSLVALLLKAQPQAVTVKPLEWRDSHGVRRADTAFGTWFINGRIAEFRGRDLDMCTGADPEALADSYWSKTLLSAITSRPAHEARKEALEEAATEMDTAAHIMSHYGEPLQVETYQNAARSIRAMIKEGKE